MLKTFEKFSFPSIEKRWTDRQKEKKKKRKKEKKWKKERKKERKKKKKEKRKEEVKNGELTLPLTIIKKSIIKKRR